MKKLVTTLLATAALASGLAGPAHASPELSDRYSQLPCICLPPVDVR